jgi:large subunit GTPase 1
MIALEKNVDVSEVRGVGKKHFKAGRRATKSKKKPSADDDY